MKIIKEEHYPSITELRADVRHYRSLSQDMTIVLKNPASTGQVVATLMRPPMPASIVTSTKTISDYGYDRIILTATF